MPRRSGLGEGRAAAFGMSCAGGAEAVCAAGQKEGGSIQEGGSAALQPTGARTRQQPHHISVSQKLNESRLGDPDWVTQMPSSLDLTHSKNKMK